MYADVHSHRAEIVKAHKSVLDDNSPINWALFGYAGQSFSLKVVACGEGDPDEMVEELNPSQVMYAFCRLTEPNSKLSKFVLVNWQGESTPALRKGVCANHMRDVAAVLHGHHVTVTARDEDEAGASSLLSHLARSSSSLSSNCSVSSICSPSNQDEPITPVCSNYRRVQPAREISVKQRDLFWRQQKLEEEERRQAEQQKEAEQRKQREAEIKRTEEEQSRRLEMRQKEMHNSIDAARQQLKVSLSLNYASPQQQEQGQQCHSDLMRAERNKEAKQLITSRICEKRAMFERGGCAPAAVTSRAGSGSAGGNRIGRVRSMGSIETGRLPDCNGHTEPRHPQGGEVKASVVTEVGARPVNDARPSDISERAVLHRQQNGSRCNGAAADSSDRQAGGGGSAGALPADSHCQSSKVSAGQHSQKKLASAVAGTENAGEPVNGRDTGHSASASNRPDSNGVDVITPREPASPAKPGRPTPHCSPAAQGRQEAAPAAAAVAAAPPAAAAPAAPAAAAAAATPAAATAAPPPATAAAAAPAAAPAAPAAAVESSESAEAGGDEQWRYGDVQIVTASGYPATVQLTREHGLCAQAMYDYQAADDTEITFDPGDIITNIDRVDVGWWQGLASDGHFGLFPANYVELINV